VAGFLGSFKADFGLLGGFTPGDGWLGSSTAVVGFLGSFTSVDGLRGFGGRCSEGVVLNSGSDASITWWRMPPEAFVLFNGAIEEAALRSLGIWDPVVGRAVEAVALSGTRNAGWALRAGSTGDSVE
jgi:hypothetical protein